MPVIGESAVKQCMAWFCGCHIEQVGSPYLVSYGKDQSIMRQIIMTYGVNKTCQLISEFFKEVKTEPFLQKTGASVGIFKSQLPKLLLKINKHKEKDTVGKL